MSKVFFVLSFGLFAVVFAAGRNLDPGESPLSHLSPFAIPEANSDLHRYGNFRSNKAFAVSVAGNAWGWSFGYSDADAAARVAIRYCEVRGDKCIVYATDNTVVWDPAQAEAEFSRIVSTREESGAIWRFHGEESPHEVPVVMEPDAPSIISDYQSARGILGSLRSKSFVSVPPQHGGIDITGAVGTPVLAAADGFVQLADFQEVAGNRVEIVHFRAGQNSPLVTEYIHLDEIWVEAGEEVRRGQHIGTVGATGTGTTPLRPHLHFATRGENPHRYWHDGEGRVTCFRTDQTYDVDQAALTYPLPCGPLPVAGS